MPAVALTADDVVENIDPLADLTPTQRACVDAVIRHNRNSEWAQARRTFEARLARADKRGEGDLPPFAPIDIARRTIAFCRAGYSDDEAEAYALDPKFTTPNTEEKRS